LLCSLILSILLLDFPGCSPIQEPERQVHLLEPPDQIQLVLLPGLFMFLAALVANDLLHQTTFLVDIDSGEAGQVSQLNERQLSPLIQGLWRAIKIG
jgi:hypothetical protein